MATSADVEQLVELEPPGTVMQRLSKFLRSTLFLVLRFLRPTTIYQEFIQRPKKLQELPKRTGEVAVLTGGSRGIGSDALRKLLQCDFHVIFGVRNINAGEDAVKRIRSGGVTTGSTKILQLDLKSLKSVKSFGESVLKETDRIDILINNAGIMFPPFEVTEDGYESQFQVNYLGHFLLTNILLPKIKTTSNNRTTCCRIVNIASNACYGGSIDFNDLERCKVYAANKSYNDSKLAQVIHAKHLDKILKIEEVNVRVYSLHPGVIPSELWNNLGWFIKSCLSAFKWLFRTTENGADVIMYTALSPDLENEGGVFICNCKTVQPNSSADDVSLQKLLWKRSTELTDAFMES